MTDIAAAATAGATTGTARPIYRPSRKQFERFFNALKRWDAWAQRKDVLLVGDASTADRSAALAYLALSPRWRLKGIVLPASKDASSDTTESLLAQMPLSSKPTITYGSSKTLSEMTPADAAGCDAILDAARWHSHRNRLTVVLLGSATDLAAALVSDSSLEERIEVVAAAFNEWPLGGDASGVMLDLLSWQALMDSDAPLVIAGKSVAARLLSLSREQTIQMFQGQPGKHVGQAILNALDAVPVSEPSTDVLDQTLPLANLLAVAYLAGFAETVIYRRPTLQDNLTFLHGGSTDQLPCQTCIGEPRLQWINTVDADAFFTDMLSLFEAADEEWTQTHNK